MPRQHTRWRRAFLLAEACLVLTLVAALALAVTARHLARLGRRATLLRRWEALLLARGLADEAAARRLRGEDVNMGPRNLDDMVSPWSDATYLGCAGVSRPFAPLVVSTRLRRSPRKELHVEARVSWLRGGRRRAVRAGRFIGLDEPVSRHLGRAPDVPRVLGCERSPEPCAHADPDAEASL